MQLPNLDSIIMIFPKNLPYDSILKIDTVPDMDIHNAYITDIVNSVKSIRTRKTNKVISEIINSMQENLANPGLSLSSIAKEFISIQVI